MREELEDIKQNRLTIQQMKYSQRHVQIRSGSGPDACLSVVTSCCPSACVPKGLHVLRGRCVQHTVRDSERKDTWSLSSENLPSVTGMLTERRDRRGERNLVQPQNWTHCKLKG